MSIFSLIFIVILFFVSVAGVIVMSILTAKKNKLFVIGIVLFALLTIVCVIWVALTMILVMGID